MLSFLDRSLHQNLKHHRDNLLLLLHDLVCVAAAAGTLLASPMSTRSTTFRGGRSGDTRQGASNKTIGEIDDGRTRRNEGFYLHFVAIFSLSGILLSYF